jgi:predicted transcriptional regulator
MTQKELADAVDVAVSTAARLEAGGDARLVTVRRLAPALELQPAQLLDPPPET